MCILQHAYYIRVAWGFPGSSVVKNLPPMQKMQEMWVRSLGKQGPLEEEMATHSSIVAEKIP